ncbi:uncharacterized protein [Clytia hemisphaerica]
MITDGIKTEQFLYDSSGYMRFTWSDCNLQTRPCLQENVDKLTAPIFSSPNLVSNTFKECFRPECELLDVRESRTGDCRPPETPPAVRIQPKFNTTFCRETIFKIDPKTFIGNTGSDALTMRLELLTENFEQLPSNEWLYFDPLSLRIFGYPRTGENTQNLKMKYKYKLRATEIKTGASSSTDVIINLLEAPTVNYVMRLQGTKSVTNQPNIKEEIELIKILMKGMGEQKLNDVSFNRSGTQIDFKWSFCHLQNTCDCEKIKAFKNMIPRLKKDLSQVMSVESISSQRKGKCNEGPIALNPMPKDQTIPVGQCYSIELPDNFYYDRQDLTNLQLFIQSKDGSEIPEDHWLQMDQSQKRICGILPYQTYLIERDQFPGDNYRYKVGAEDQCGNQVTNNTEAAIDPSTYFSIDYVIVGILQERKGDFMSNCTRIDLFITKVANYSGVNKTEVLVKEIRVWNETVQNLTEIIWGYRIANCTNETFVTLQQKFIDDQNKPNLEFQKYMKPDFEFEKLRNESAGDCGVVLPPLARVDPEGNFPWWVLWCILALALLILLCWFLWICCPRACPGCCDRVPCWRMCGGLCGECCTRPGTYSSFKDGMGGTGGAPIEEGVLAQPRTEPELYGEPPEIPDMNFNRPNDGPETAPQLQPVDEIDARPIVAQQQEGEMDPGFFGSDVEDYPQGAALPQSQDTLPTPHQQATLPVPQTGVLAAPHRPTQPLQGTASHLKPTSLPDPRKISESIIQESFVKNDEATPEMQSDFSGNKSVKTESYTEERVDSLAAAHQALADIPLDEEVKVETYRDNRPSVITIDERNTSYSRPKRMMVRGRSKERNFQYADALVDSPIIFKTRRVPKVSVRHERRNSESDGLGIRRKSRSSVRRVGEELPITLRVEDKPKTKRTKKEAKLIYKEPRRRSRGAEFVEIKAPRRRDKVISLVEDEHFIRPTRKRDFVEFKLPKKEKRFSTMVDNHGFYEDDFDDVLVETRGRSKERRDRIQMASWASGSTDDSGIYDQVLIKPSRKSKRYKEDTGNFISTNTIANNSRRHKSSSPSRRRHEKVSMSKRSGAFERQTNDDSMNFVTSRRSGGGVGSGTTTHYFSNKWDDSSV